MYVRKDHIGLASRFVRNFDGPFIVLDIPYGRSDLLRLRKPTTNQDLSHPINIEKVVLVPDQRSDDLQTSVDTVVEAIHEPEPMP